MKEEVSVSPSQMVKASLLYLSPLQVLNMPATPLSSSDTRGIYLQVPKIINKFCFRSWAYNRLKGVWSDIWANITSQILNKMSPVYVGM